MKKNEQIKRNHHYIWRHYLKPWTDGRDIYYTTKNGKIALDSIKGLAVERDFYKIKHLDEQDIHYLRRFASFSPEPMKDNHNKYLDDFINIQSLIKNLRQKGNKKAAKLMKIHQHNSFEGLHTIIENEAKPVLEQLTQENFTILDNLQNKLAFLSYIGHQLTRTKSLKESSLSAVQSRINTPFASSIPNYELGCNLMEKNWWFLSFIFGTNIGFSLYITKDKDNHSFLRNNTMVPFITSDRPVINVHKSLKQLPNGEAPENMDLYFPISPQIAFMINESDRYNDSIVEINEESDVMDLNKAIAQNSYRHTFSNSMDLLKKLQKHTSK